MFLQRSYFALTAGLVTTTEDVLIVNLHNLVDNIVLYSNGRSNAQITEHDVSSIVYQVQNALM